MKYSKARAIVAISFILLMVMNFIKGLNEYPGSPGILLELLNIYSVQLTLIIMFYFTQNERKSERKIAVVIPTLLVFLMTIWNGILFYLLHIYSYTAFLNAYPEIIDQSNFLIVAGIAYFFTKPGTKN